MKKNKRALKKTVVVSTVPSHTHFSIHKMADMLNLKKLFIEPNQDGSMDVQNLEENLIKIKEQEFLNFIVCINFGTTTL